MGFVSNVCASLENPDFFCAYTDAELGGIFSDGFVVGAFLENKMVGFGVLLINDDFVELDGFMVLSDFRNMGIWTELIKQRFGIAEKRGLGKAVVKVHPDNAASIKAIRKNGFVEKENIISHGCPRILFEINIKNKISNNN